MCRHHLEQHRDAWRRNNWTPEKELQRLIRSQEVDIRRGNRIETQRFGPRLERTYSLTEIDLNREGTCHVWTMS